MPQNDAARSLQSEKDLTSLNRKGVFKEMLRRVFIGGFAIAIIFASIGASRIQGQQAGAPTVSRAVYWSSADAEVYLVEKNSGGFKLTVTSKKEFRVTYHTRINSLEPVDKELAPINSAVGIRQYEFSHSFTKMTIWMALEFSADGKSVPELTRTFLNDIGAVVANGYYDFGPKKKP